MNATINWKKIGLYLLFAFGISWSVALVMKLAGIQYGGIVSVILTGGLYMAGPALSTLIVQKFIYKEKFKQYGWTFSIKKWKWFLKVPLIFLAMVALVFVIIALIGNTGIYEPFGKVDFSQAGFNERFNEILAASPNPSNVKMPELPALLILALVLIGAIIAGFTVNLPFMFGEEFGWRGLLIRETQPMGFLKSNLLIGVIWGLWHTPLIMMGHNYPDYPYFGIIMMCFFTMALTPIFSYVRLRTGSIIGPCLLHGMINGCGQAFILFTENPHQLYSSIAGFAGVGANLLLLLFIYLFDRKFFSEYRHLDKSEVPV